MLRFLWQLSLFLTLGLQTAHAGPWAREAGQSFLSLSTERDQDDNSYTGLYGEYGITERTTAGVEIGHSSAGENSLLLWLQRALDDGQGPDRLTMSAGLGMVERNGLYMPVGQLGSAWGRGLQDVPLLRQVPGGGWVALDARVKISGTTKDAAEIQQLALQGAGILSYITPETTSKAEATLGWNSSDKLVVVNQIRLEERDDTGFSSKYSLSAVQSFGGPAKVELGLIEPISGVGERAVKLGTWFQF